MQQSRRTQQDQMTRRFGTPLNKPSQATPLSLLRMDLEGGKRADGAGKGRVTPVNTGQQRSLTVNNDHSKTWPGQGRGL